METDTKTPESVAEFWKQHVEACLRSGESGSAYCKIHSLVYHRFVYWRQKFHRQVQASKESPSPGFVPVRVEPMPSAPGLGILLPNGLRIDGICAENIPVVRRLLASL